VDGNGNGLSDIEDIHTSAVDVCGEMVMKMWINYKLSQTVVVVDLAIGLQCYRLILHYIYSFNNHV